MEKERFVDLLQRAGFEDADTLWEKNLNDLSFPNAAIQTMLPGKPGVLIIAKLENGNGAGGSGLRIRSLTAMSIAEERSLTFRAKEGEELPQVTAPEACNLLQGKAVYKQGITGENGERFNAWVQVRQDTNEAKRNILSYREGWGYDLDKKLESLNPQDWGSEEQRRAITALQQGEKAMLVLNDDGENKAYLVEANPSVKGFTVYTVQPRLHKDDYLPSELLDGIADKTSGYVFDSKNSVSFLENNRVDLSPSLLTRMSRLGIPLVTEHVDRDEAPAHREKRANVL